MYGEVQIPMPHPDSPATYAQFRDLFPDEAACDEWLARWRWPDGFTCPKCGVREATRITTRPLWQCHGCRHQTSVTAGTALHRSKLPLATWLYALWLVARRKNSVSALQLQRELGVAYRTAWLLLQKVRVTLGESPEYPLERGVVEVDESMIGGRSGRKGRRLGEGGAWLVLAVERIVVKGKGERPPYRASGSARAAVTTDCKAETLMNFIEANIKVGALVTSDAFPSYQRLPAGGFDHWPVVVNTPATADIALPKTHLFFSNFKAWLIGTFHGVTGRYLPRYVNEFLYRFNRRRHDESIFGYLARRTMGANHSSLTTIRAAC